MTTIEKDDGRAMEVLGVVDRTLYESWKELPWQARLCPRAIEEQEDVRRAFALKKEVIDISRIVYWLTGFVGALEMFICWSGKTLDSCFERSGR